ncbi:MAG TPA: MBL fold metallo-hydrolase [Methanomicrobia archaeon]|nr:MBL fold metallo-hydrolase [Methanomicrobia archaeon]
MVTIRKFDEVYSYITTKRFIGRTLFSSNVYATGDMVIDSGMNGDISYFSDLAAPSSLVLTHAHIDHAGNARAFAETFGAPVYADERAIATLSSHQRPPLLVWCKVGRAPPVDARPLSGPIETTDGVLEPLHTPGHCADHTCYYQPSRRHLFSGDLVLHATTTWVSSEVRIWEAIESLKRISRLRIDTLFPGHGEPFTDPHETIVYKHARLEALGRHVLDLSEDGMRPEEIRDDVLGREEPIAYLSRGRFSKLNLIKSFLDGSSRSPAR